MHVTVVLGAGFSKQAGSPLAHELFDQRPPVHRKWVSEIVLPVSNAWERWKSDRVAKGVLKAQGEEFLADLYRRNLEEWPVVPSWAKVVKFIGLRLAWEHADRGASPYDGRPWGDDITSARTCSTHEAFWNALFKTIPRDAETCVITTNYDIWAERGLRLTPRPRLLRPGFHYGIPGEQLLGYTSFPRRTTSSPRLIGSVPLLKLHGSLTWEIESGERLSHVNCGPAFRGTAAIVPPLVKNEKPSWLSDIWELAAAELRRTTHLLVAGYSLPVYDSEVRSLLSSNLSPQVCRRAYYIAGNSEERAASLRKLVPGLDVNPLGSFPECILGIKDRLQVDSA